MIVDQTDLLNAQIEKEAFEEAVRGQLSRLRAVDRRVHVRRLARAETCAGIVAAALPPIRPSTS